MLDNEQAKQHKIYTSQLNALMDQTFIHLMSFDSFEDVYRFSQNQKEIAFDQDDVDKAIISLVVAKVSHEFVDGYLQHNCDLN